MDNDIHNLDEVQQPEPSRDELREENADGSVTLTLKYPTHVQYKSNNQERDETIEKIRVRRSNGGDLRMVMRFQKEEEKVIVNLFTRLTGLPEAVFDRLDADDIMRFSEEVERFLPQSPATGMKS